MAYHSLILGILFSIGIFAIKSGVGLHYILGSRNGFWSKAVVLLAFLFSYSVVFLLAALVLKRVDLVRHLDTVQSLIRSGMLIHLLMAGLMAVWGVALLKQKPDTMSVSRGWLLLVLPCPVCATVIAFYAAFLFMLFPDQAVASLAALYTAFILISAVAATLVYLYEIRSRQNVTQSRESLLGGAMLLMAAYFLLSVTLMPQFGDLDKVYRLACYPCDSARTGALSVLVVSAAAAAAFSLGWGFRFKQIRR